MTALDIYRRQLGGAPQLHTRVDNPADAEAVARNLVTPDVSVFILQSGHHDVTFFTHRPATGDTAMWHSGPDAPLCRFAQPELVDELRQRAHQAGIQPGELNLIVAHLTAGRVADVALIDPDEATRLLTVVSLMKRNRIDARIDNGAVTFVSPKDANPVTVVFQADGTARLAPAQQAAAS